MKRDSTNDCTTYCNGCGYKVDEDYFSGGYLKYPYCGYEVDSWLRGMKDGCLASYSITGRVVARGLRVKKECPYYTKKKF